MQTNLYRQHLRGEGNWSGQEEAITKGVETT